MLQIINDLEKYTNNSLSEDSWTIYKTNIYFSQVFSQYQLEVKPDID